MTRIPSRRTGARSLMALTLVMLPLTLAARAQDNNSSSPSPAAADPVNSCAALRNAPTETRTYHLANVSQQNDANEIMVAIRNLTCPGTKIYLVASQNAILIEAPASQLALAEKILQDLDHSRKAYRLLFTITEIDNDKTISTQHVSMVAVIGLHASIKEGDKIPVATGSYTENSAAQTQFTYIDVGMNFDATLTQQANGVSLESKVEHSSVGPSNTIAGVQEPVIRQTVLQGTSLLTVEKPVMLGSIDVPNTARRFDIAVVLQLIK